MSTLALDTNNDLKFTNGKLVVIANDNSDEEILQRIKIRLRFFKEEWFLNINHGLPYFQDILGGKGMDLNILESIFKEQLLDIKGVAEVIQSSIDYTGTDRKISYTFQALSVNNTIITDNLIII